ncbi:DUF1622 domain-containing protein [Leifsonia poae]|uniref:DUF1622 domain-containing protein n=1 Tax=Leifsonia poae TaxID=110933 RepID=UPI001CC090B7|nr:DUF1622 domain-containing protein [Leifsonia poae]
MIGHTFFEAVAVGFEVAGVAVMVIGFVVALLISARAWLRTRNGQTAFRTLRESFGGVILLGLEVLVAADIVKTLISPSLNDVLVLALIVLIRTVLSFSLQIEIDGVAPWRRALVTGPERIAQAAKRSGE